MIVDFNDPRTCWTCEHEYPRYTDEHGHPLLNGCRKHGCVGGSDGKDYRCNDWKRKSCYTDEEWKDHVKQCQEFAIARIRNSFR